MKFRKLPELDGTQLHKLHWEELLPVRTIALKYGVSPDMIRQRMRYYEIPIRTISEDNKRRYASMTPEEIKSQTLFANSARRGSKASAETLILRAKANEGNLPLMSNHEKDFYNSLTPTIQEKLVFNFAIDKFNIDFTNPERKLAIEIHGGNWHSSPRKRKQDSAKREYLENHGWTLIEIWSKDLAVGVRNLNSLLS